jgi:hypothetical protein
MMDRGVLDCRDRAAKSNIRSFDCSRPGVAKTCRSCLYRSHTVGHLERSGVETGRFSLVISSAVEPSPAVPALLRLDRTAVQ